MKVKILLLFFVSIVFYSCIEDAIENSFFCEEEGELIGDFPFSDETASFFPYTSGLSIVYLDSFGNELLFDEDFAFVDEVEEQFARTVCGNWGMDVHETDTYIHRTKAASYRNDALFTSLNIILQNIVIENTDTSFLVADLLTIYGGGVFFNYITDEREAGERLPPFYDNDLQVQFFEEREILGRTFSDVYWSKWDDNEIFYNKEFGVIGFTDFVLGLLVFDRFE